MFLQNGFLWKMMRFYMRIITLIAIIGVGIVCSNTVAYAENSKTPNHIVVFPVWAEEILLELVDTDCIVWVGHPYLEEAETYWPTMKDTKEICGSIWQETDDSEILKLSPDLIICPDELSGDYDAIFPNLSKAEIPVVFMKQPETVSEIIESIFTLGNVTHQEQKATELCNQF